MDVKRHRGVLALLSCCLLSVVSQRCEAQNLVPNPSFEEVDTCLELNTVYYPDNGPLHWFSAGGTSDHFLSCLPYGSFNGSPLNAVTYQTPYEGEAYAGVITYDGVFGAREYFMVELAAPLEIGLTYYASFFVNAAFLGPGQGAQVWVASSKVGMLFTTNSRQWESGDDLPIPVNHAHVLYPDVLVDTVAWVLVSGSFVADSAYQYVMIGNHFDNANTDTLHFEDRPNNPRGYTVIDNVCVSPTLEGCPLTTGVGEQHGLTPLLFPNPAVHELVVRGAIEGAPAKIIDGLGRKAWEGYVGRDPWRLDMQLWTRGYYVLQTRDKTGWRSFKFVLIK